MPYGYYEIIRLIGMDSIIYIGFEEKEFLKYFWFSSAVLINPIIKIPLVRKPWNVIDVILALILLVSLFLKSKRV